MAQCVALLPPGEGRGALHERFAKTAAERDAFDRLCSGTQAWLRREIEALRFTKAHCAERMRLTTCNR